MNFTQIRYKNTIFVSIIVMGILVAGSFFIPYTYADVGDFISTFGSKGSGDGQFDSPKSVAVDTNNRIIVVDKDNDRIQIFEGFLVDIRATLIATLPTTTLPTTSTSTPSSLKSYT